MEIKRLPQKLQASITLPASKSISNRLLILREISGRKITVSNLSEAEDTRVLAKALELPQDSFIHNIDVGNAGTAMRFLTAYLSYRPGVYLLTGNRRMQQRPIGPLVEALQSLGARIAYVNREGYPPLYIEGGFLRGGKVEVDASQSSQFVSALMLVAPALEGGLEIFPQNLVSMPYVMMTLQLLRQAGVDAVWNDSGWIVVPHTVFGEKHIAVEADWSSAAFWYGLLSVAKGGDISMSKLGEDSVQGDKCVAGLYKDLGVRTFFEGEGIRIEKNGGVKTDFVKMDLNDCPDVAVPYIVSLVLLGVRFELTGLHHLHIKESDRIQVLSRELKKIGIELKETSPGTLAWEGKPEFGHIPEFDPEDDHRLAMALVQVAHFTDIRIKRPEVVAKSYPDFWQNFKQLYQ